LQLFHTEAGDYKNLKEVIEFDNDFVRAENKKLLQELDEQYKEILYLRNINGL
jgi:hypothetical protein